MCVCVCTIETERESMVCVCVFVSVCVSGRRETERAHTRCVFVLYSCPSLWRAARVEQSSDKALPLHVNNSSLSPSPLCEHDSVRRAGRGCGGLDLSPLSPSLILLLSLPPSFLSSP